MSNVNALIERIAQETRERYAESDRKNAIIAAESALDPIDNRLRQIIENHPKPSLVGGMEGAMTIMMGFVDKNAYKREAARHLLRLRNLRRWHREFNGKEYTSLELLQSALFCRKRASGAIPMPKITVISSNFLTLNQGRKTMTSTALTIYEQRKPLELFARENVDGIIEAIENEARSMIFDISTNKGRDELRSYARKIATTKTTLDKLGKSLTEEQRAEIERVNKERKIFWDRLEALQHEIRKPLTEFEEREEKRVKAHEVALEDLAHFKNFEVESVEAIVQALENSDKFFHARNWEEFEGRAKAQFVSNFSALTEARDKRIKYEADQAELKRLREAEEARLQKEREDKIAADAAAEAKRLADKEAEDRLAKEREETARVERAKVEAEERAAAAEKARKEAEEKAEHDRIEAEKKAAADIKAAEAKAEADRLQAIEDERKRVAEIEAKEKAEREAREANEAHVKTINDKAIMALAALQVEGEFSPTTIVKAIASGLIPNVKIQY
jgi:hypothetical protein